jgi:hypothetical protein
MQVLLCNRDLLTPLVGMVEHLSACEGITRITILDNGSTWPPLLEWYRQNPLLDVRHVGNRGPKWMFSDNIRDKADFYLASDADLDLSEVPKDFAVRLREKYRQIERDQPGNGMEKIGLSLAIHDLPMHESCVVLSRQVIGDQARYWTTHHVDSLGVWYDAFTDTTMAVYRGEHGWGGYKSLRLGPPYTARHLPWYYLPGNLPEEFRYYLTHAKPFGGMWSFDILKLADPPIQRVGDTDVDAAHPSDR